MIEALDPVFAAGVRRALVERPSLSRLQALRSSRRGWLIGLLSLFLVGTAGVATALLMTRPGGQIVTELSAPVTASGTGDGMVDIGPTPAGADAVQFEFICLSSGRFMLGVAGPSWACGEREEGSPSSSSRGQVPLDAIRDGLLSVTAGVGDSWTITAQYVATDIAPLAVNARGETYGSEAYGANPDLISAVATNGREGYIRRTDLDAATGPEPSSPPEAIARQDSREPGSTYIPVFESDGVTVIGQFEISH